MQPPSPVRRALLWGASLLALGLLIGTYAAALPQARWPRGHPWHGIALAAMAAFFAVQTRLHRSGTALRAVAVALPLVAVLAMAFALARGGG